MHEKEASHFFTFLFAAFVLLYTVRVLTIKLVNMVKELGGLICFMRVQGVE